MLQLKIVVILITLILNHAFAVEGDIISGEESTCAKKATEYTSGLNQMMEVSKGINSANNRSVGYNLCMAYRIAGPDRNEKLSILYVPMDCFPLR